MIPAWSPPRAISSVARIIPSLTMPRSFAAPSVRPSAMAPRARDATVWPAATFGAPQTIVTGSPAPTSTCRRAAVGVGVLDRLEDAPDDVVRGRGRTVAKCPLDLQAVERERARQLIGPELREQ